MTTPHENVSADLIWECVNGRNSYLHKSKMSGGVSFSRDPFNLINRHSRRHEGFVNLAAISVQRPKGSDKGLVLATKKRSVSGTKPASSVARTVYGPNTPGRKVYRSIAAQTAKRGYRPDLRGEAVARTSTLKQSSKPKKEDRPVKLRGGKKKRAEAAAE